MGYNKTQADPKEGKIILNKGTRNPGGHSFEIFIDHGKYFATIIHAEYPQVKETFEIVYRKHNSLEEAVDKRITELKWDDI